MKQISIVFQYIFLSIIAALLLLFVALFKISNENHLELKELIFVSITFIISCIIGISLTVYPGWIRRVLKNKNHELNNKTIKKIERKRQGHHPNCEQFKSHTIKIKNKILCAGCFGLAIGSIISILLIIIYIFFSIKISSDISLYLLIICFIIIGLVFLEIMLNKQKTVIHIISNGLLIISFLTITISITEITGSAMYGIISIILSFLWLDTRIQLSNWNHGQICKNCNKNCKMY